MRRAAANLALALSIATTLAACWLWPRAFPGGAADAAVCFLPAGRAAALVSADGQLVLVLSDLPLDDRRAFTLHTFTVPPADLKAADGLLAEDQPRVWRRAGFTLGQGRLDSSTALAPFPASYALIGAPHWTFALAGLVLPALRLRRHRRTKRRARKGQCLTCGYDLRATTGRCPECGTPPAS